MYVYVVSHVAATILVVYMRILIQMCASVFHCVCLCTSMCALDQSEPSSRRELIWNARCRKKQSGKSCQQNKRWLTRSLGGRFRQVELFLGHAGDGID